MSDADDFIDNTLAKFFGDDGYPPHRKPKTKKDNDMDREIKELDIVTLLQLEAGVKLVEVKVLRSTWVFKCDRNLRKGTSVIVNVKDDQQLFVGEVVGMKDRHDLIPGVKYRWVCYSLGGVDLLAAPRNDAAALRKITFGRAIAQARESMGLTDTAIEIPSIEHAGEVLDD